MPVKALLEQYKANDSAVIKQLDLSFIQHSLDRLDVDDRVPLIPLALHDLAADEGQPRAATMLNIVLRLLLDVRIPPRGSKDDETLRSSIGLSDTADARYLSQALGVFFRLRAPTGAQSLAQSNPALSEKELQLFSNEIPDSDKIFGRLSQIKAKLVVFLASGALKDDENFLPALYAAAGVDGRVASAAEDIIKRSSVSMEDEAMVRRLFHAHSFLPAAYRTRILGMLSKSAISTTMTDNITALVQRDFVPQPSNEPLALSLQPTSALERTKLHNALFQYLSWVARVGPSQPGFVIGQPLIRSMTAYIEMQGWPAPKHLSHDQVNLRSRAYETIGTLARSADLSVEERLDLGAWLFRSLSQDPTNDAVVNIDGALSSLTPGIPPSVGSDQETLSTMLLAYMALPDEAPAVRSTRHAVVKWANQYLPFSDIRSRWIDILAVAGRADERSDVVEQGHRGLDPWTHFTHGESSPPLPDWKSMVVAFFDSLIEPQQPSRRGSSTGSTSVDVFQNFPSKRIQAFPIALRYCKQMMLLAALDDFHVHPGWMQELDAQVKTDVRSRDKVRAYLETVESEYVVLYLKSCLAGAFQQDSPIVEECIRCFVEVASLSPQGPLSRLTDASAGLLGLIKSNNKEVRRLGARALGILAAHPTSTSDSVASWVSTLCELFVDAQRLVGSDSNAADGALLALGYLISRSVYYDRDFPRNIKFPLHLVVGKDSSSPLHASALESFSQLWSVKLALPPADGEYSIRYVVEQLYAAAKRGNEKAVIALGSLAMGLDSSEDTHLIEEQNSENEPGRGVLSLILKELLSLHEVKQVELQFAVGDAITAALARWDSDYVHLSLDVEVRSTRFRARARGNFLEAVLGRLLQDSKATKPSLLKASGVWLFCIVQYCSHLSEVQSRLREVQVAFMRLLTARDELVQETASRGLSLVYERGDSDLKSALVKDLVSAFTGSGTQLKVGEETELFEPGALPTREGNSVTSYKDIVNLANEVGDRRLVYKFMSLAANAATWSTRSAFGRFGLSNILSDSEIDPKLYPKLYRYRFDPNANVQRSIESIWKALVKDSNATLEAHLDAIMRDLLESILGREWRVRQASCAAVSDLVQGRPFAQYERYYRDIWTAALKVLDDVKGSVREAALRLCMALSNSLVRQLEEDNHAAAAKSMMREALPFLLSDKGVESSVEDVQIFATVTVLKISKHGGKALRPFIPDMVPQLLGLLSAIEPQQINYHYQRAGEESLDKIDRLRSQMVNQSPISEAIENCLHVADGHVVAQLGPRLEETIKSAMGMPTKIGCSRVLTTLATRHASDVAPVSNRLMELLAKQITDKNDEVSQAYARAAAYVMRTVPADSQARFCERCIGMYMHAEDESRRQKIADAVVALAKISPDHFTAHETELVPFYYLGSSDCDDYARKVFQEVWSQHAGSSRTVLRYVPEIAALVERCLETAQWSLRHTGAFAVAAMVDDVASASDTTNGMSEASTKAIWPLLDKAMALKTFAGKERLLEAFPRFVEQGQLLWKQNEQVAAQMKKIALREARRNNDDYRIHAFRCLWRFAKARGDLDMLHEISEITKPYLEAQKDENKMEVDSKTAATQGDVCWNTAKSAFEAVARGYAQSPTKDFRASLRDVIDALGPYLSSPQFEAIKRELWYDCVCDMMADGNSMTAAAGGGAAAVSNGSHLLTAMLESLDLGQAEAGTEVQRLRRAQAVSAVLRARRDGVFGSAEAGKGLADAIKMAMNEERAMDVHKTWRSVLDYVQHT